MVTANSILGLCLNCKAAVKLGPEFSIGRNWIRKHSTWLSKIGPWNHKILVLCSDKNCNASKCQCFLNWDLNLAILWRFKKKKNVAHTFPWIYLLFNIVAAKTFMSEDPKTKLLSELITREVVMPTKHQNQSAAPQSLRRKSRTRTSSPVQEGPAGAACYPPHREAIPWK